jgi:hypothetical protein
MSDDHIKHLVDTNDKMESIKLENGKDNPNQLYREHCHARFNYYEYDGPNFGLGPTDTQSLSPESRPNFPIHLEDLEQN